MPSELFPLRNLCTESDQAGVRRRLRMQFTTPVAEATSVRLLWLKCRNTIEKIQQIFTPGAVPRGYPAAALRGLERILIPITINTIGHLLILITVAGREDQMGGVAAEWRPLRLDTPLLHIHHLPP